MYNKKRLGQTAALLLTGVAVGLAGGAFAAASLVPTGWDVTPITNGAYRETFQSAPTWGEQEVTVESKSSHASVPSRLNAWFATNDPNNVLKLPGDASYTNTLEYASPGGSVSFAVNPVFVDVRVLFTAYDGEPAIGDAKLAVYASASNTIHVVHNGGTTTNTWGGVSLLDNWHQLTVRLQSGDTCAVLLNDIVVTNGLTQIGATTLNSLAFTGDGYIDDLYVSHGNPQAYPGETDPVPVAAAPFAGSASVAGWLAGKLSGATLTAGATFAGFTQEKMDAAYLLDKLGGTESAAEPPTYTFGSEQVIVVSATEVHVKCSLTVTGGTGTLARRLQLLGKATIGGTWGEVAHVDNLAYTTGKIEHTFTGIDPATYKFFKAQIVEIP